MDILENEEILSPVWALCAMVICSLSHGSSCFDYILHKFCWTVFLFSTLRCKSDHFDCWSAGWSISNFYAALNFTFNIFSFINYSVAWAYVDITVSPMFIFWGAKKTKLQLVVLLSKTIVQNVSKRFVRQLKISKVGIKGSDDSFNGQTWI